VSLTLEELGGKEKLDIVSSNKKLGKHKKTEYFDSFMFVKMDSMTAGF
jgi:hypothetical protein